MTNDELNSNPQCLIIRVWKFGNGFRQFPKALWAAALLVLWLAAFSPVNGQTNPANPSTDCLILYDASGEWGWIGELHGIMLANLLGHFPLSSQIKPVEDYQAGDLNHFQNVFYFGNEYDNALGTNFLQDILTTTNTVCWFQYNLWQLSDSSGLGAQFRRKFGFYFDSLDSSGYSNISYKGELFSKDQSEPELGRVRILDAALAHSPALAWRGDPTNSIPYIIHSSNFWYIADAPFSYISEEDRYLVFADILHDIVQQPHEENHCALLRLEDIDPTYPTNLLREAADYLASQSVPFAVAVIPVYSDRFGIYNNGIPEQIPLSAAPQFVETLEYLKNKGGQIVMHGCTHQYDSTTNPYTGVSGDDYEFFRVTVEADGEVVEYRPLDEDSPAWVQHRLQAGLSEFHAAGLFPVAWETPHYTASALDYHIFATNFAVTMQRVLYFDSFGHSAGQFFPYPIEKDIYGQRIIPENLGNVDPIAWQGYPPRLPEDLVRAARKNRVVRDGWASAFFHPYLDINYLKELVGGIKSLGYIYVPLVSPPQLTVSLIPPRTVRVSFASQAGFRYHLESSTNLANGSWQTRSTLNGNGGELEWQDSVRKAGQCFYRVRID